jgi:formylglycine-generating enzyme required for sulfatase activity
MAIGAVHPLSAVRRAVVDMAAESSEADEYVTVRGGSWGSTREQLLPAFRGSRLLFSRSQEIGFRCVYEPM